MFNKSYLPIALLSFSIVLNSCAKDEASDEETTTTTAVSTTEDESEDGPVLPSEYFNYANQSIPSYITKDNTEGNEITDAGATLGRVLFYDVNLSENRTISCGSCHQQEHAFSDIDQLSVGLNGGLTGRHSMRLINARFSDEEKFFWDERATSLEDQTTKPIQDHVEMGFSGEDGDPSFDDLLDRLSQIEYYEALFQDAFGDSQISEERMQLALAQFIRSIQSFDSKFDAGYGFLGGGDFLRDFPNYTDQENLGKRLYFTHPNLGGAGCNTCHGGAEFSIDPNSGNNGIVTVAGSDNDVDMTNFRSPSLRDLLKPDGTSNGAFMHDGSLETLMDVVNHYNEVPVDENNTELDSRLNPPGPGNRKLDLSEEEKEALVAFLETLSGNDVYENEKWSDPFEE